jgi:hypothetical protein
MTRDRVYVCVLTFPASLPEGQLILFLFLSVSLLRDVLQPLQAPGFPVVRNRPIPLVQKFIFLPGFLPRPGARYEHRLRPGIDLGPKIMTVFAGLAELERDLIGDRTGAGREAARRRGDSVGVSAKVYLRA